MQRRSRACRGVLLVLSGMLLARCEGPAPVAPQSPPQTIQDLRVSAPGSASALRNLLLQWTVPEDPDTHGPPASYEIRHYTRALAGDAWLGTTGPMNLAEFGRPGQTDSAVVAGLDPGRLYYFAVRSTDAEGHWSDWSNVASLATQNVPPVASFTIRGNLCQGGVIEVDGGASTDAEDPAADLVYRWDWESDGTWDTPWSGAKTASLYYATAGWRVIRLQVRDRGGSTTETARSQLTTLTSIRTVSWEVEQCCEPGPHGACYRVCSFPAWLQYNVPGRWDFVGLLSFVSPDSIVLESHIEPSNFGIQGMNGVIDFQLCNPLLVHVASVGSPFLRITGPAGTVFPPEPQSVPPPADFTTVIPAGAYHADLWVGGSSSLRVLFASAP